MSGKYWPDSNAWSTLRAPVGPPEYRGQSLGEIGNVVQPSRCDLANLALTGLSTGGDPKASGRAWAWASMSYASPTRSNSFRVQLWET